LSVGLSKNNIFLEFDNNSGRIFRAYKTSEICKDFKVIHDLDGRYKIVLIFQNGFFEVIKPRYDEKNLFESVYKSKQSTVALDIIDDITGHQVLRVQYSPTTHEMLDFVEKRTHFQASNDVVENSLSCQLQNAEKSVQEAKKEVLELEQVLDCAVTDLASDDPNAGISMKEVDVLKSLFNKDDLNLKETKMYLKIVKVKQMNVSFKKDAPITLLYIIKNETKMPVNSVKLAVLNEGGYQVKILHDTTLEKMINDQIIQGICNGFGTVQTLKKFTESKELLHPNEEITILLQVHPGKYDDSLHLQLQFVSSESETKVQRLPKLSLKDENNENVEKMTEMEELYARLAFSDVKKCLQINSILNRHFELESVLSKLEFEQFNDRIHVRKDIICVLFKQNSCSYRLDIYANTSIPLKIMVKEMYGHLKDDILITIEKNIIEPKISKKFALIDEIEAIQKNRKAEEIITDRVFLS
jgi:hypothetical protein